MRRGTIGIGAALAAALAAFADEPRTAADARRVEKALQTAIAKAEPAIACLLIYRPDAEPVGGSVRGSKTPDAIPDYYASGVVIDPTGLILTNYHAIREAAGNVRDPSRTRVYVRLPARKDDADGNRREGYATLFAADVKSDLAVLKLNASYGPHPTVPFGRGEDLKKGSLVASLGHPYAAGYRDGSPSASWGIVSNLRRRAPGSPNELDRGKTPLANFSTLIQTDVRLQLGTSGGALLDLDGRLVGLTTAQAALTAVDSPGGFAVPMDESLRRIVEVLLRGEEVEYGFLGISTPPDAAAEPSGGMRITSIIDNSPAYRADLQSGDVILKVNGRPIRESDDLFLQLAINLAGRRAELLVRRGKREHAVDVTLVKAPVGEIDRNTNRPRDEFGFREHKPREWFGLRVEYTSVIARESAGIAPGVLVREVAGQAKMIGLVPYSDIITRVNDEFVNSPADFSRAADKAVKGGGSLKLTLADSGRTVTLPIP